MNTKKSQEEINKNKYNAKFAKIIKQKNVCDLIYLNFQPKNTVKKIDKNHYIKYKKVIKRTYYKEFREVPGITAGEFETYREDEIIESDGKVHEYMSKSGERNKRSLRKIFNDMRYLMNNNFVQQDADKQLFITLTYKENMQDTKKLYLDFLNFMKRLQRGYKDQHDFGYIVIMEPQGRGAWHCHLLLKTMNQPKLTIPWCYILRTWGHGMIKVEKLKKCNNFGSYFVAYMAGLEVDDEKIKALELNPDDVETKAGKRVIKGERLKFYPDYMKIYRNSKNMLKPEHIKAVGYNDLVEIAEEQYPRITYQTSREIETDHKTLKITKEQRRKI